jgi:hypothetical protein
MYCRLLIVDDDRSVVNALHGRATQGPHPLGTSTK